MTTYRTLYRRQRREAEERRRAKAREEAMLAVRGGYDAPRRVLRLLGPGELAAYHAQRKETKPC